MTTETLKALIARIEAGETGRVIDVHAYWATHSGKLPYSTKFPPRYSTSLDAVMALKDEVLPDWSFEVRPSAYGRTVQATAWHPIYRHESRAQVSCKEGNIVNPAAALLAAILKAKEAGND